MRAAAIAFALTCTVTWAPLEASSIAATPPKPDAHDKALSVALDAKVQTFRAIAKKLNASSKAESLNDCPLFKKDSGQAFAALFALVPALFVQLVNDFRPQLHELRDTVDGMHPDSPLFREWTTAQGKSFALILSFDNHGKKVDFCQAATVMLDKKSSAADIHRVLGIDPLVIATLFQSPVSATLDKLDPKMRTFFLAAGLSRADAKSLTS